MDDVEQSEGEHVLITDQPRRLLSLSWQWLPCLILAVLIVGSTLWLNSQQNQRAVTLRNQQQATAQQLATDQQHETLLINYIDGISNLVTQDKLLQSPTTDTNRLVATARTIEVLRGLDVDRKATVLRFLYMTKLINNDYHIIDMAASDLHDAHLSSIDIRDTYLTGANFSGADLSKANLSFATLVFTNFSKANLTNADLHGTDLHNTNFTGANLKGANLKDAVGLDVGQLEKSTHLLSGAILPDGTVHR